MSTPRRRWTAILFLATLAIAIAAHANPRTQRKFLAQYPSVKESKLKDCASCHVPNTVKLNSYGQALKDSTLRFPVVEALDSDEDGVPNGLEIELLTFPGDAADKPDSAAVASARAKADSAATRPDSAKAKPE